MTLHIVARHIKLTNAIKKFTEEKIGKLKHYFANIVWAQVILTIEKKAHRAEIVLHASKQTMRSQAEGKDLYLTITNAIDKMEVQIKKYNAKLKKNKHHKHGNVSIKDLPIEPETEEIKPSVVKQIPLHPTDYGSAVMEMERLGYNFWLFLDEKTKQINIVFKRQDNSYGLIEPVKKS
jgi:putative sigma-54 modulation protein